MEALACVEMSPHSGKGVSRCFIWGTLTVQLSAEKNFCWYSLLYWQIDSRKSHHFILWKIYFLSKLDYFMKRHASQIPEGTNDNANGCMNFASLLLYSGNYFFCNAYYSSIYTGKEKSQGSAVIENGNASLTVLVPLHCCDPIWENQPGEK